VLVAAVGVALVANRDGGPGGDQEVAAVLAGADRVVTLVGTGPGEVRVAHGRDDGALTVLARGVPAAEPGTTYQLWLVTADGGTRSAGLFSAAEGGDDGTSTTRLGRPADADFDRLTALAVTREPARGSPAPTGPVRYQAPW
jgi:anti-sigma-K factor RskA